MNITWYDNGGAKNICMYCRNIHIISKLYTCKTALYQNIFTCFVGISFFPFCDRIRIKLMMKVKIQDMPALNHQRPETVPLFDLKENWKSENICFCVCFGDKEVFIINRIDSLSGCLVCSNWYRALSLKPVYWVRWSNVDFYQTMIWADSSGICNM